MNQFNQYIDMILDDLNWDEIRFKYREDDASNQREINIFDKSGALGYITWDMDDGEVVHIFVGKDVRRKGLGTYLWELATDISEKHGFEPPSHSSRRTMSGDEFAKSIGGHLPDITDDIDGWLRKS